MRDRYYALATKAIRANLITSKEVALIARVGHRKEPYWDRHYRDLKDILIRRARGKSIPRSLYNELFQ